MWHPLERIKVTYYKPIHKDEAIQETHFVVRCHRISLAKSKFVIAILTRFDRVLLGDP